MAAPEAVIRIDATQFRALLGKTSTVDVKAKNALRRRLRNAALPIVRESQAKALGPGLSRSPHPRPSTGLRRRISAGVKASVRASANTAGVLLVDRAPMAGAWDREQGWRHPYWGNRDYWAQQFGEPFFRSVVLHNQAAVARQANEVMSDAVREAGIT